MKYNNSISLMFMAISLAVAIGFSPEVRAEIEFNDPEDPAPAETVGDSLPTDLGFEAPDGLGAPPHTESGGVRSDDEFSFPQDATLPAIGEGSVRGDEGALPVLDLTSPETTELWEEVEFLIPGISVPDNTASEASETQEELGADVSDTDESSE
ncbi:MAG: hypothetical protein SWY16_01570 [Cyanobacteriota bacterium]|nr:hypothetical protein [Cyanobacteriota bacterium]